MNQLSLGERTLTELDHVRLSSLLRRIDAAADSPLDECLASADLVPSRQVGPDVVTMYSQLQLVDAATGRRRTLTLCYPADAEPDAGFVSVLSPVGAALLGRRVGSRASWVTPDGRRHEAEIVAVLFQPEASGDYTT